MCALWASSLHLSLCDDVEMQAPRSSHTVTGTPKERVLIVARRGKYSIPLLTNTPTFQETTTTWHDYYLVSGEDVAADSPLVTVTIKPNPTAKATYGAKLSPAYIQVSVNTPTGAGHYQVKMNEPVQIPQMLRDVLRLNPYLVVT